MGKVIRQSVDDHGKLIGTYDENPVLNSHIYEVEFPDREIKEFAANILAENCLSLVDPNSHPSQLLDCITNVRCDDLAIAKADGYNTSKRGQLKRCQTTVDWNFQMRWKDGTKQWVPLSQIKESNPIEVADFVKARGIDDEPGFIWWVPHNLRKRDMIIAKINSHVSRKTHKFGIEVPT